MRAAYECFRTGSAPDSILAAAAPAMQIGGHDAFYRSGTRLRYLGSNNFQGPTI